MPARTSTRRASPVTPSTSSHKRERTPRNRRAAMLMQVVEWLASTSWSIALHESLYLYPLIESTHVLTLTVFVGLTVMLDLRLLGLAMKQVPASEVIARLVPWAKTGFVIMAITGLLLF